MSSGNCSRDENSRIRNEVVSMYKNIVAEVDPKDVLDLLIQKRVISIDRKDEVMSKTTRQDKCRALLDQLFCCSHNEAFVILREALKEHYHWIVERIDDQIKTVSREDASFHCSAGDHILLLENPSGVMDMVKRLETLELRTDLEGKRLLEKQNRLYEKKDLLKQELELTRKTLDAALDGEQELMLKLDEATGRIMELEEEVNEFRTKNARLESQLYFLQDSYDTAVESERTLREEVARLKIQLETLKETSLISESVESCENIWNFSMKVEDDSKSKSEVPQTPPPLPPRRSISSAGLHMTPTEQLYTACYVLKDIEIKVSDLHLVRLDESHQDTEIWNGKWKETIEVTVKKLIVKNKLPIDFFREARILHKLKHECIAELIGISSLAEPLYIVTEYLHKGNLRDFLRSNQAIDITLDDLIHMATQIAGGMTFIAQKGIIHRDLRARNIFLGFDNIMKVSNFELALDVQDHSQNQETVLKFPIKWTAPESLETNIWTKASDVWSFGVLLHEMFTLGEMPYSGKSNSDVYSLVASGYRLPCPDGERISCPDTIHLTMLWCWDKDPEARPTFQMLEHFFQDFFTASQSDASDADLLSRPTLVGVIKGSTAVRGMAILDGLLYIVRFGSTVIEIYNGNNDFKRSRKSITITPPGQRTKLGLLKKLTRKKKQHISSGIQDIASCNKNKRLYLSDWQNTCVHSVDPEKKDTIFSWAIEGGEPWGISVTLQGNIVVSCGNSGQLCEYSPEGVFIRAVDPAIVEDGPWHGIQVTSDKWVLCHGERYGGEGDVCVVDLYGTEVPGYDTVSLKGPSYLAVISTKQVLVAESGRNRVVMLNQFLRGPIRVILNPDHGIIMPVRLHLCESSGRLAVGSADGSVIIHQILNRHINPSTPS